MNWRKIFGVLAIVCLTLFLFAAAIYAAEQYKQQNREAISQIVDGKHDKAIKHFKNYLKKNPPPANVYTHQAYFYNLSHDEQYIYLCVQCEEYHTLYWINKDSGEIVKRALFCNKKKEPIHICFVEASHSKFIFGLNQEEPSIVVYEK